MKLAAIILCVVTSGCFWVTTKSEGQKLRDRLDKKEQALDEQIAQLKKVLDDATRLLKRNSADLGADVESLRTDLQRAKELATSMSTSVTEVKTAFEAYKKSHDARLDSLEQRLAQLESGKPSANTSPEDLWKLANDAYGAQRYNDAVELFKRLTASFPTHDKADDALYMRGQCYGALKEWEKAIAAYQLLLDKYPDGQLTDDGMYNAALAAVQLKQCGEARTYLGIIKSKFPKSNVTKQATDLDTQLKKDAKNKAKCAS
jgi:TolA-binding protein